MKDAEIDEALTRAARAPHPMPAELLERIADSLQPGTTPVRRLPATWILVCGLLVIGAAVALLGASRLGFGGFETLSFASRVGIFGVLTLLGWFAAARMVAEWVPGSRRRVTGAQLLALICVALLALFAFRFRDYRTDHFVSAGARCLSTGLLFALPAALFGVAWLRRGWVVSPVSAGLVAGALAGLAGLTLLELQCTNFQAFHILLWHVLVVPLSGAAGAALGWGLQGHVMRPDGGGSRRS